MSETGDEGSGEPWHSCQLLAHKNTGSMLSDLSILQEKLEIWIV